MRDFAESLIWDVGIIWELMNRFADQHKWQCEVTHIEVESHKGDVKRLMICGCFSADDKAFSLAKALQEFATFLPQYASSLKLVVPVVIGFNYDEPGRITIDREGVKYETQDLLDDLGFTRTLYDFSVKQGISLDEREKIEEKAAESLTK